VRRRKPRRRRPWYGVRLRSVRVREVGPANEILYLPYIFYPK
jgi:hypothetical protein